MSRKAASASRRTPVAEPKATQRCCEPKREDVEDADRVWCVSAAVACQNGLAPPLYFAAQNGNAECVASLLEAGADPSAGAADEFSPLRAAVLGGRTEAVRLLLEAGADAKPLAPRSRDGTSLLHLAAARPHMDAAIITDLIRAGAGVEATDGNGQSPLHYAAEKGWAPAVQALLDVGADPGARDASGFTPEEVATPTARAVLATAE